MALLLPSPFPVIVGVSCMKGMTPLGLASTAAPVPVLRDSQIVTREFMPSSAMRPSRMRCRNRLSPEKVRASRDWIEMGWVHTVAHAAKVVELATFGDRPDEEFVGHTVRWPHLAAASPRANAPIAASLSSSKEPAAFGTDFDLFHEPVPNGSKLGRHSDILPCRSLRA